MHLTLIDAHPTPDPALLARAATMLQLGHRVRLMIAPNDAITTALPVGLELVEVPARGGGWLARMADRLIGPGAGEAVTVAHHAKAMVSALLALQPTRPTDLVEFPLEGGWAAHRPVGILTIVRITRPLPADDPRSPDTRARLWARKLALRGLREADYGWTDDPAVGAAIRSDVPAAGAAKIHLLPVDVASQMAAFDDALRRHRRLVG